MHSVCTIELAVDTNKRIKSYQYRARALRTLLANAAALALTCARVRPWRGRPRG
jgi:hypothetical protein